jgi:putative addiction module component (TIGR02574 family)
MATSSDVLNAAMALNSEERAAIAHQLLLSLEPTPGDPGIDGAWADEVRRRREAIRNGHTTPRDWDTALSDIRKSIASKKPA